MTALDDVLLEDAVVKAEELASDCGFLREMLEDPTDDQYQALSRIYRALNIFVEEMRGTAKRPFRYCPYCGQILERLKE